MASTVVDMDTGQMDPHQRTGVRNSGGEQCGGNGLVCDGSPAGTWSVIFTSAVSGVARIPLLPRVFRSAIELVLGDSAFEFRGLQRGDMLVQVKTVKARDKLLEVQELRGYAVTTAVPKQDSVLRGVIRHVPDWLMEKEIQEELVGYGVVRVSKYGPTTAVLEFGESVSELPHRVTLYQPHAVSPYIVKPTQCWKCLDYFHFARDCSRGERCLRCGKQGHRIKDCTLTDRWCCARCGRNHRPGHRDCPDQQQAMHIQRETAQS